MIDVNEILKHPAFINVIEGGVSKIPEGLEEYEPFLVDADPAIIDWVVLSQEENKEEFKIALLEDGKVTYVGPIVGYKIVSLNEVRLRLQNGFTAHIYLDKLSSNKSIRQVLKDLKENILFVMQLEYIVKKGRENKPKHKLEIEKDIKIIVKDYFPVMGEKAAEEKLLELKALMPKTWLFDLHVLGIGINIYATDARYDLIKLYLPRILGLYTVPIRKANKYNHILQFTYPGTGKTQFYLAYLNVFNMDFESRFPTRARAIFNGATGEYGIVFVKDYVVIDAFDKALNLKDLRNEFFSYAESGLSEGKWSSEVSSTKGKKGRSIERRRYVGFAFLGNIDRDLLNIANIDVTIKYPDTLKFLEAFLESRDLESTHRDALRDRLSIVDINTTRITLARYILPKILLAPYLMALKDYTQKQIYNTTVDEKEATKDLDSRRYNYGVMIAKKLRALGIEPAEEVARALVAGQWDWYTKIDESVIKPD
jgi:hypothetical protein